MKQFSVGVIGGTGWMGSAMVVPCLQQGILAQSSLLVCNRSGKPMAQYPDVAVTTDAAELAQKSECVVLSCRPADFPALQMDLSQCLVISIMAGVSIEHIASETQASRVIRAMPNAAAEIGHSYTPYVCSVDVSEKDLSFAEGFFTGFGGCDRLENEEQLSYFTALTGSSHGTLAFIAQSLVAAAQEQGIDGALAERAVRQVMLGVGELVGKEQNSPQETVTRVIDYGGTTCRLLRSLYENNVDKAIAQALLDSYERAASDMTQN